MAHPLTDIAFSDHNRGLQVGQSFGPIYLTPGSSLAAPTRCVSVPFTTVSTYTERRDLSEELKQKLGKPYPGHGLAHAVAVTGLGGTGKTQLVLRYLDEHEEEYDTILWLDAWSEETIRSSFERCCATLRLPIDNATSSSQGLLRDAPAVHAVLQWLRSRVDEKKWLVVLDNAEDLSWRPGSIVPYGRAGSVIVTSQDSQASRLLGGRSETVKVEVMTTAEATSLFRTAISDDGRNESISLTRLSLQVVDRLDRLPLAIDLAGARISADVEDGEDVEDAVRQYLADFDRYQDRLLGNKDFALSGTYDKTVWTVWETSLSSIRRIDQDQPDASAVELLTLLTSLNRANIQEELFRLASLGLKTTCQELEIDVPPWLQRLLTRRPDGAWDDFSYRASVKALLRYGLVRSVKETWKGLTMHSLVQWRARQESDRDQRWSEYMLFITAATVQQSQEADRVHFRRHVIVHLPSTTELLAGHAEVKVENEAWLWTTIGQVWEEEGRWKESEQLFLEALQRRSRLLGEEHPSTLSSMANLASTYRNQGRWTKAEELEVKVMEASSRVLSEEHPSTLTAIANLASTYWNQGRWTEAEELEVKVMEASSRVLSQEHPSTLTAMANLASTYWNQGRWTEAEELDVKVMEARSRVLGQEHPSTLTAMANLASTYWNQGRWTEAEELDVKVIEARSRVLGEEHPDTLTAIANLASTYLNQGRQTEAEELQVKVIEASSRVLGEEHPDTLRAV